MRVLGVDGCRGGWVGCITDPELSAIEVLSDSSLRGLIDRSGADRVVIDMPIGLSENHHVRRCETEARKRLPGKTSSVFNSPIRAAVEAGDYTTANRINRAVTGKGIPPLSWAIVPKIREVDSVVRAAGADRIREGHPELSFAVASGAPILAPKVSAKGAFERLACLARVGLGAEVFDLGQLAQNAGFDDLLDAAIMAWSAARLARSEHLSFPEQAEIDACGLPMQMVA